MFCALDDVSRFPLLLLQSFLWWPDGVFRYPFVPDNVPTSSKKVLLRVLISVQYGLYMRILLTDSYVCVDLRNWLGPYIYFRERDR